LLGKDSGSVVGAGLDGWRIHCFDHDGLAVWESGASTTSTGDADFDIAHAATTTGDEASGDDQRPEPSARHSRAVQSSPGGSDQADAHHGGD
jgi:hypothetical protein